MLQNAVNSLLVGGALSILLFLPVVIWQYRRYGEVAELRLGLIGALLVYSSALVAYTMFPLPTDLTDAWCARHRSLNTNPFEAIDRVRAAFGGVPLRRALLDRRILEMVLNIALFVPLGWFGRRIGEWRVVTTLLAGLAVSLLIEVTQLTGVFGVFRCAYRMADAVDLVTNTTGTLVGVLLAFAFPRLFPRTAELEAQAHRAREVDKGRRWLGQILDGAYFVAALAVVGFGIALAYWALGWASRENPEPAYAALMLAADVLVVLFAVASWTGDGSSLGQRTTYLRPLRGGRPAAGWRRLLRPCVVLVPVGVLVFGQPSWVGRIVGLAWAAVAMLAILVTRRGLSGMASGVEYADSRARAGVAPLPAD